MVQGILPRHFLGGLITMLILCSAAIVIEASDNSTVSYGANSNITASSVCKKVTNNSGTGLSVYVPTETSEEWTSFYTNPPAGILLSSCVTAGSQTYTTPGIYTFTIPEHNSLTVELWGAGAGGTGQSNGSFPLGGTGGASTWDGSVIQANGGNRGGSPGYPSGGSGGTASGGSVNMTGGAGTNGSACQVPGNGGTGANGGAGGARGGNWGSAPGGGGGGNAHWVRGCTSGGGGGGGGSYASRTYDNGDYMPGSTVTIVVGAGGAGGSGIASGGRGADGKVVLTWQ